MRELFGLEEGLIYLNHGPFGAVPHDVMAAYRALQEEVEQNPIRVLGREFVQRNRRVREILAEYMGVKPEEVVWVNNATHAVNTLAHSLILPAGSEILTTDHEYGACLAAFREWGKERAYSITVQPIELPGSDETSIVDALWQGVSEKTRLIFLSHITSDTAVIFPVEAICRRAKDEGIMTFIDGAHALGQIPLDLSKIGCDFYTANAHKWLMAPRGAAFFYAREEVQPLVKPLVVSWGTVGHPDFDSGNRFIDTLEWRGTQDPCPFWSIPAAIEFQQVHDWGNVRERCRQLVSHWLSEMESHFDVPSNYPFAGSFYQQMATCRVPDGINAPSVRLRLREQFHIELQTTVWRDNAYFRLSVQGYNDEEDIERCVEAIKTIT